jgi:hypothetical protein
MPALVVVGSPLAEEDVSGALLQPVNQKRMTQSKRVKTFWACIRQP